MRAGERGNPASAYLYTRVADIVLGLIDERLGLFLRLYLRADGGFQVLNQLRLFGTLEPGFDLRVISLPAFKWNVLVVRVEGGGSTQRIRVSLFALSLKATCACANRKLPKPGH
jgi:hypothetical protein